MIWPDGQGETGACGSVCVVVRRGCHQMENTAWLSMRVSRDLHLLKLTFSPPLSLLLVHECYWCSCSQANPP